MLILKKSLLILTLVAVLVLAFSTLALANAQALNFDQTESTPTPGNIIPYVDMHGHWAYEAAIELGNLGYMQGTGGGLFDPEQDLDRAMAITILWNMEGNPLIGPYIGFENGFLDASPSAYYHYPLMWAAYNKLTTGSSETHFGATDSISREQLVCLLYRYAEYKGWLLEADETDYLSTFADANTANDYAVPALEWALANNIISGTDASTLNPSGFASRAAAATLIYRFCQLYMAE